MIYTEEELATEKWKDIFYDLYKVSNLGRILSVRTNTILNGTINYSGYVRVKLNNSGDVVNYGVHQLVALAFLGDCPEGMEVNHKEPPKTNNRVSNLEYKTHLENIEHAMINELTYSILNQDDVREIRLLHRLGATQKDLANAYLCSTGNIYHIIKRNTWKWVD